MKMWGNGHAAAVADDDCCDEGCNQDLPLLVVVGW